MAFTIFYVNPASSIVQIGRIISNRMKECNDVSMIKFKIYLI